MIFSCANEAVSCTGLHQGSSSGHPALKHGCLSVVLNNQFPWSEASLLDWGIPRVCLYCPLLDPEASLWNTSFPPPPFLREPVPKNQWSCLRGCTLALLGSQVCSGPCYIALHAGFSTHEHEEVGDLCFMMVLLGGRWCRHPRSGGYASTSLYQDFLGSWPGHSLMLHSSVICDCPCSTVLSNPCPWNQDCGFYVCLGANPTVTEINGGCGTDFSGTRIKLLTVNKKHCFIEVDSGLLLSVSSENLHWKKRNVSIQWTI